MWGRNSQTLPAPGALAAIAALALCPISAHAQKTAPKETVAAAPLGQTDPWSVGWLGKADGALASTLWSGTDTTTLSQLMSALVPAKLSPASLGALRHVILSSARGPKDGADLIPERLRLLELGGETERSIDLRKRFPQSDWGKDADLLASRYELAGGRSQSACDRAADKPPSDPDWIPVRALCYAIAGDLNAASGISEHAVNADGQANTWLIAAIATLGAAAKTKPAGRYDTPLHVAVSIVAKLSVPNNALDDTPPDIALAIVRHPGATPEQKRAALRPAADGGRLSSADILAVINPPPEPSDDKTDAKSDGDKAKAPARTPTRAKNDFLALALDAAASPDLKDDAKSTAIVVALKDVDDATDFHIAALALHGALKGLPRTEATQPNAEAFARAAIAAHDLTLALDWRKLMDRAPAPASADTADAAKSGPKADKADPPARDAWTEARLDLMLSFAGAPGEKPADVLDRLIDAVPPAPDGPAAKAANTTQRQAELRRIENTRALFLYVGAGRPLNPAARALLSTLRTAGRGIPDGALARIQSALDAHADGEAALAVVNELGPDPSALSFAGLSDLVAALRGAGMEKDANAIILEALQPWKAL